MQLNITDFASRMKSHSFEEHARYWFPRFHKVLVIFSIRRRISIFKTLRPNSHFFASIYWVITRKHIKQKGFRLSNYGVWLAIRPNDITYNLCLDASYRNNLEKILDNISEDTIFVDIGANIGVFSLVAELNPKVVAIHSFEPDSESFNYLVKNIFRSKSNRITSHNYAVGNISGEARLTKNIGHSGISRIADDLTEFKGSYSSIKMVNHKYLNLVFNSIAERFFVKIDVEGYEYEVLKALETANFFPSINKFFIEFDQEHGKIEQVEAFLRKNNFTESGRWSSSVSHWDALWVR
jgi:FkbM family methyltransferase